MMSNFDDARFDKQARIKAERDYWEGRHKAQRNEMADMRAEVERLEADNQRLQNQYMDRIRIEDAVRAEAEAEAQRYRAALERLGWLIDIGTRRPRQKGQTTALIAAARKHGDAVVLVHTEAYAQTLRREHPDLRRSILSPAAHLMGCDSIRLVDGSLLAVWGRVVAGALAANPPTVSKMETTAPQPDLQNGASERKPAETKREARSPNQIGWVLCHCGSAAAPGEKCPVCGCVGELAKIMASAPTGRE